MRYRVIDDISPNHGEMISPSPDPDNPRYLTVDDIAALSSRPVGAIIATLLRYGAVVEEPDQLVASPVKATKSAPVVEPAVFSEGA